MRGFHMCCVEVAKPQIVTTAPAISGTLGLILCQLHLLPNLKPRHGYMCRGFFISIEVITGGVANPTCRCTALVMLITQQAPA